MINRMKNWRILFAVLGWVCVVGGVIAVFMTSAAALTIVIAGLSLLFTAAALDWMDGVLGHLQAIRDNQAAISERLRMIEHNQAAASDSAKDE